MKNNVLFLAFLTVIGLSGCYPGGPEFLNELDVVVTDYNDSYDFGAESTYSLPDGVIEIDGSAFAGSSPEFIDSDYSDAILNQIRINMTALGFTEVDEVDDPDIVMLTSAMSTTNLYFYDPGWWSWYYPGYYPGWSWYYPGYYPGYVSGYTTGTILIQMTDPNEIIDEEIPVVWSAAINGLLEGSKSGVISRIDNSIDKAYDQSPYLAD